MFTEEPTAAERETIAGHRAYLDRMAAAGVVLLFGRTETTDPSTFGTVIFRAVSPAEPRGIMVDDPAVRARVMRGEVFPFRGGGVGPAFASPA